MPSNVIAPGILTLTQIMFLLRGVGFPEEVVPKMLAIAQAENESLDANKINNNPETGDLSYGIFQINMKDDLGPDRREKFGIKSNEQLLDPETNAKAAYLVWKEASKYKKNKGDGLKAWTGTYGKKRYNQFLPEAKKLVTRTRPTNIPARSQLREEMKNNIKITGVKGMSKPITRNLPTDLDDIAKIPVGGKEYTLGAAQDLFVKGDTATKNKILSILQQYNPNTKYTRADTVNTAWNKLVENYAISNSTSKKPFTTWLASEIEYNKDIAGTGDGTSIFLQPTVTTKEEAYQDFNDFIFDATGMNANPKDAEQYYKELRKLEKSKVAKQVTTRTGTTTTQVSTPGITKEDRELLAARFVDRYIDTKGVQNVGGVVGSNLSTLRKFASSYNVVLSDADVRKYAINALTDKNALENSKLKIKNIAKIRYPQYAKFIDEDLTMTEIASPYINAMSKTLEINPNTITLDNRYVDNGLTNNLNFTDFNKFLRNTPEFPYTNGARAEAAEYINMINQDFRTA